MKLGIFGAALSIAFIASSSFASVLCVSHLDAKTPNASGLAAIGQMTLNAVAFPLLALTSPVTDNVIPGWCANRIVESGAAVSDEDAKSAKLENVLSPLQVPFMLEDGAAIKFKVMPGDAKRATEVIAKLKAAPKFSVIHVMLRRTSDGKVVQTILID